MALQKWQAPLTIRFQSAIGNDIFRLLSIKIINIFSNIKYHFIIDSTKTNFSQQNGAALNQHFYILQIFFQVSFQQLRFFLIFLILQLLIFKIILFGLDSNTISSFMFACFQPIEFLDRESQILEGVLIQKFQSKNIRAEQIEENCKKLTLPNPIIRSSSLSKIHNSNKKLLQFQTEKQSDSKPKQLKSLKRMTKNNQNQNQLKTGPSQDIKSMIVDKLSQKNQIYSKLLKKPCNKQNLNQKQITHVPAQSFYHKHQNMDKILNIYKEKTQKQFKQCTFNPKINAQSMFRKNDQKQFFKQQIEYHKKTEDKIQQIRSLIQAQKQKQNTFKPKLSQQTAQMTQRRAKVDVYDRLYDGKTQEKNCTQRQNSFVKQNNQGRRPNSKKSISVLSSSRKVSNTSQTKKQKLNGYSVKKFTDMFSNNSKQLVRQKSSKMFSQLLKDRKQGNLMSNTLNPDNKNNSNNHMTLNSVKVACQKKQNLQSYGLQLLDCRELIKQKSRSNNILSKEQSCKIIKNAENPNLYETSLKKSTQNSNKSMQKTCLKQKFCVKNQRITLQRFIKEFIFVVKKNNLCSKICFSEMLAIIKDLNFIQSLEEYCELQETFELRNQSICKAKQIWRLLQGDQNEGILLVNLYKILCSILGYHNDLIKNQVAKILQASLNQDDEQGNTAKRLILSEKDSISLKKQFICLYSTRLQLGQSKFVAKQINANHFSFRPSVSKQSVEFAQKHRQKVIAQAQTLINQGLIDFQAPENGLIGHFELLALQEKIKMHKLKVMREEVQKERKKLQDQSMIQHSLSNRSVNQTSQSIEKHKTSIKNDYQLNSHNFSRISHQESQSRSKDQIFIDLYENGKHLKSNRRDRSIEQIQYQESKDELTFKPKISSKNKQTTFNKRMNLHQKIPNFTKEVMRMKKKYSNPNQQISPLLYLNVAMQGNGNVKIPVYENDSFKSLTEKVRILMNIQNGEEQRIKLTHILQDQIIPALNKIGVKSVDGFFLLRE